MAKLVKNGVMLLDEKGLRNDGRRWDELRSIKMTTGVLERADGSAIVETGGTKVLAAVYGPREVYPKHLAVPDKAIFRVAYRMASFSVEERKKPQPSRREIELSKVIKEAIEPAIFLEQFPRTVIDAYVLVLQADGGTRVASINAVSLALADAGIPMKGLVSAIAVGRLGDQVIVDLNDVEDKYGDSDMPIAMIPITGEITLFQMDGTMNPEIFEKCLEVAKQAISEIYKMQREVLRRKYLSIKEQVLKGDVNDIGDKKGNTKQNR